MCKKKKKPKLRVYEIVYSGAAISLNDFYSQNNYKSGLGKKKKFKNIFKILMLEKGLKWMNEFKLDIRYRSRNDVDNVVGTAKIFVDVMKGAYIKDDNRNHYKSMSITYDETLKHNTFIFKITQLK